MRLILICLLFAGGQASGQLIVGLNDATPVKFDAQTLAELPRQRAVLNDYGKQVLYEGVSVHDVLVRAGVDFGEGLRGNQLSSYVTAIGQHGMKSSIR